MVPQNPTQSQLQALKAIARMYVKFKCLPPNSKLSILQIRALKARTLSASAQTKGIKILILMPSPPELGQHQAGALCPQPREERDDARAGSGASDFRGPVSSSRVVVLGVGVAGIVGLGDGKIGGGGG